MDDIIANTVMLRRYECVTLRLCLSALLLRELNNINNPTFFFFLVYFSFHLPPLILRLLFLSFSLSLLFLTSLVDNIKKKLWLKIFQKHLLLVLSIK